MNYELKCILKKIKGAFICVYNGESNLFSSIEEFEKSNIEKNCMISSISAQEDIIILELKKVEYISPEADGKWAKEYERQFGEKPSFF